MPTTWNEALNGIVKLGVPSAIALGVVYWLTMSLDARLAAQGQKIDEHMATTRELVVQLKQDSQVYWQLVALSQRICLNTAKTDADRMSCVVALPGAPEIR